jgi:hypothetical protein
MAMLPVTPDRTAYAKELGDALALLVKRHPRVPVDEALAIQAQMIGHCIASVFPQREWPAMLEAMVKNISIHLEAPR